MALSSMTDEKWSSVSFHLTPNPKYQLADAFENAGMNFMLSAQHNYFKEIIR